MNSVTIKDSPLYKAGLDIGDEIARLDGKPARNYYNTVSRHRPGDTVEIIFYHKGKSVTSNITFEEDNELEIATYERAGIKVAEEIIRFRQDWFSSKGKK